MADKIEMRLLVTEKQADTIRALFGHNEWELDEIPVGEREMPEDGSETIEVRPPPIAPVPGEEKCQHCFATPCVTSERHRQLWWEVEPYPPRRFNNTLRKHAYRKFWSMLANRGIWSLPEYVEKKDTGIGS